jgi:hypothetical protein
MLIDDRCSIYEDRPQTCRDYDCRVLAAAGIEPEESAQMPIAERARKWRFEYLNAQAREEHSAVKATAAFLREHRNDFPADALPNHPNQLAVLAIKVYETFCAEGLHDPAERPTDTQIVKAVMEAIEQFEASSLEGRRETER